MQRGEQITVTITDIDRRGYSTSVVDGKTYKILGGVPGDVLKVSKVKSKRGKVICRIDEIVTPSQYRLDALDESYLSTSPFQVISRNYELFLKSKIINDLFKDLYSMTIELESSKQEYGYRNKMEFSFYIDDEEVIHTCFFRRDSKRGKVIADTSAIASSEINIAAQEVTKLINRYYVPFRTLKGITLRSSIYEKAVIGALFIKDMTFDNSEMFMKELKGLNVFKGFQLIYSEPKSPAFRISEVLEEFGEIELIEQISDKRFNYNLEHFFQVNVAQFDDIIRFLREEISYTNDIPKPVTRLLDLYSGVGTIAISVADLFESVIAVELVESTTVAAKMNLNLNNVENVVHYEDDSSKFYINYEDEHILVVDPPRAGLGLEFIEIVKNKKPSLVFYVSCNPYTQHEDLKSLLEIYEITKIKAFDMYPNTPHLESVAILKLKSKYQKFHDAPSFQTKPDLDRCKFDQ